MNAAVPPQPPTVRFADRATAGEELGRLLGDRTDAVVLAIPSGGVPVAAAVARILGAPLDLLDVHEITAHRRDLGVGAVSSTSDDAVRPSSAHALGVSDTELAGKTIREQDKLTTLLSRVRAARPAEPLEGRLAIVVDDALAVTPAVAAAAFDVRARGATRAVLAVPVAVDAFATAVAEDYDEIVCLERVAGNLDLGDWYATLDPVEDDEVIATVLGQR